MIDDTFPSTPLEKVDLLLSGTFGTQPAIVQQSSVEDITPHEEVSPISSPDEQVEADHAFARNNMYSLLQQGQEALHYALSVAKQSESPRAFEVVGSMMKNLADMSSQLLDLHEKKTAALSKQRVPNAGDSPTKVVNNSIVFSGSTSELSKMLNDMRKEQ
jgi:hypothetical protein